MEAKKDKLEQDIAAAKKEYDELKKAGAPPELLSDVNSNIMGLKDRLEKVNKLLDA